MPPISGGRAPPQLPLLTVVEYLESPMSKNLLCKFPDNSAFDFDYAQSSIWSPLLPPPPAPPCSDACGGELSRKLSFDGNGEVGLLENTRKMAAKIKRKLSDVVSDYICRVGSGSGSKSKMKRRKRKSFGFSPAGSSRRMASSHSSPSLKAWAKVIKAATKHFKKRKIKKKKDNPYAHLDLSNYKLDGKNCNNTMY